MKIGIIGTGLIGGSLGLSLKEKTKDKYYIYCYNRAIKNSQAASDKGAIDEVCDSIGELTQTSDIIILCTPISSYAELGEKIYPYFKGDKVISDVGSVKSRPMKELFEKLGEKYSSNFVPCHPIAGKEVGGIANAEASLFDGKLNIITPSVETSRSTIIREMWMDAGARNVVLDPEEHDKIFAKTSHLPQYLSYMLKSTLYGKDQLSEFMRLSDSPFEIWRDIFHYNEHNIVNAKKSFLKILETEKERFFSKAERTDYKNPKSDVILASLVAKAITGILSEEEKVFCGTGYKSFTSILDKNILQKPTSYSSYLEKSIENFINEIKNSSLPRGI